MHEIVFINRSTKGENTRENLTTAKGSGQKAVIIEQKKVQAFIAASKATDNGIRQAHERKAYRAAKLAAKTVTVMRSEMGAHVAQILSRK